MVTVASMLARLRPAPEVKRGATLVGVLYAVQLCAGVINPVLLADRVWIALVRLCAAGLAEDAPRAVTQPAPVRA